MDQQNVFLQRRQFGRRKTNVRAVAILPGRAPIECKLENISEGGALLQLGDEAPPSRPFRLSIDGTSKDVYCEVRHHGKHGTGVRFLSAKDGAVIMRELYPGYSNTSEAVARCGTADRPEDSPVAPVNQRELRDAFLTAQASRRSAQFLHVHSARSGSRYRFKVTLAALLLKVSDPHPAKHVDDSPALPAWYGTGPV